MVQPDSAIYVFYLYMIWPGIQPMKCKLPPAGPRRCTTGSMVKFKSDVLEVSDLALGLLTYLLNYL